MSLPLAAPARLALLAIVLVLAWRIIHVNVLLYEDTGRPRYAPPAAAGFERERRAEEDRLLRQVLSDNPAEVAALLMVARSLEAAGDAPRAARAYRTALDIAPYERDALVFAAAYFLRHDAGVAVDILARLAANHPDTHGRVFPALAELLVTGRHTGALKEVFAANPAWLGPFLHDACARGLDPALVAAWLPKDPAKKAGRPEAECAIDRLRASGRWLQAYQLWLNTLPRERLGHVGFVFNGGFEHDPLGGFDWVFDARPARESGHAAQLLQTLGAAGKRALRVGYDGGRRQSGIPVLQYLALEPGDYELTGMARPEGVKAARGIHWTIRCLEPGRPAAIVATSERFLGSSEWRRFAMPFHIPVSCAGQVLQLEPVAPEGTGLLFVAGTAWFDDLRVSRRLKP